jgi:hypothetical protein
MPAPTEDQPFPPLSLILPAALLLALHALALVLLTRGPGIAAGPDIFGIYNMAAAAGAAILLAWILRRARDGDMPLQRLRAVAWGFPLLDLVITLALGLLTLGAP